MMKLKLVCGTSLVLLLALAAPAAGQSGSFDSTGNTASGEGSAELPSSGGGNTRSAGGVAPTTTPAPTRPRVFTPAPRVVTTPAPTVAPHAATRVVRTSPTPAATPDRRAQRAAARAREERIVRARAREQVARQKRDATRRAIPVPDRNAVEGDAVADSVSDSPPVVELQPVTAAAREGEGSLGIDLTLPLLLLAASVALVLATRHAVRSLRPDQPR
jgi:hypothetical protein